MSAPDIELQEPVPMCHTSDNNYWCHGWVDRAKFRGRLLSDAPLFGDEDTDVIIHGRVYHGWIITVAGDTSGCGWDTTLYFTKDEPVLTGSGEGSREWDGATVYEHTCRVHRLSWEDHDWDVHKEEDCSDEEQPATVVDGPHRVTWWEPAPLEAAK